MLIPQSRFIETLRELGYTFKVQRRTHMLYRRRGSTNRVAVPRQRLLAEDYVRTTLRRVGAAAEQIEALIESSRRGIS